MTMDALRATARKASEAGLNTLLIEWEASLPFAENAVLSNRYAFTKEEIEGFVSYCSGLGLDVIPLQNCFGHCEYILSHPRYSHLREVNNEMAQVCPTKEDLCAEAFSSIFADVASLFPSDYIHIGADETRLLGRCPECAEKVAKEGLSALFVDYMARMCEIVHSLGKTPIIWADMLLKHPEAAERLPKDLVILDWNYGWKPDRFGDVDALRDMGFEIWGAPALRSWPDNLYLVQWYKHFHNLTDFIPYAKSHGYSGMIETSWSTSGTYGLTVDDSWDVYALQPVREVYPLSAFDPLFQAFSKAVNTPDSPLDEDVFLMEYAQEHFGLVSDKDKALFCSYFKMKQNPVTGAGFKDDTIMAYLDECNAMRSAFASLKPRLNKKEFRHYLLMLDLRINYLSFMLQRARYEDPSFNSKDAPSIASELKSIVKKGKRLRHRFCSINRGFLKDPKASYGRSSYLQAAENLYGIIRSNH